MSELYETTISFDPITHNIEVRTEMRLAITYEIDCKLVQQTNVRGEQAVDLAERANIWTLSGILYGDIKGKLLKLRRKLDILPGGSAKDSLQKDVEGILESIDSFEEH